MKNNEGTCQICERKLKTPNGLISHHGYTRPGYGWQTSSCYGARELPYEKSCDLIHKVIESLKNRVVNLVNMNADWLAEAPEKITINEYNSWTKQTKELTFEKPKDFDLEKVTKGYYYGSDTYEYHFNSEMKARTKMIIECDKDIERLQKRIDDWVLVD